MIDQFDPDRLRLKAMRAGPAKGAGKPAAGHGSWIPWPVVAQLARLRLSGSAWQVLFLLASTSCRYGGRDVRLSIAEIAEQTKLPIRTVKAALAALIRAGHVRRPSRYRRLVVAAVPPATTATAPEVERTIPTR